MSPWPALLSGQYRARGGYLRGVCRRILTRPKIFQTTKSDESEHTSSHFKKIEFSEEGFNPPGDGEEHCGRRSTNC